MSYVVFTDIDDTVIQTERKCSASDNLYPGAVNREGKVISFYTEQQHKLLNLFNGGVLIPVTGRNYAALCRTKLDFKHEIIINHGALVLNSNHMLDEAWYQQISPELSTWRVQLAEWAKDVQLIISEHKLPLRVKVIEDFNVSCYVSIKVDNKQNKIEDFLSQLAPVVNAVNSHQETLVHINGSNMALLPPYASKANAVTFLKQKYQAIDSHTLFVGAGDSLSDLGFMKACDYLLVPKCSQISDSAFDE
ncbi:HAD family hydrolase [Zooshikella harenae]|uniref:Sucrose phosphatase-like domain-containing protein n=1 Tax=Zooshikella harenae TaxID=2827238 RepID=A0ABS5ZEL3_9GAMM|nr:HAD family hydrolase [Zooshikella harenae]MBU2712502.1 hypothetical protein [Zooshikella harenae]